MTNLPSRIDLVNIDKAAGGSAAAETAPSRLLRGIKGIIFDFDGTLFDNAFIAFYLITAYPPDALRIWRERLVRKSFAGRDYSSAEDYYRIFFTAMGKICSRPPGRIRNWYFNRYMPRMIRVLEKHYRFRPGVQDLFKHFETDSMKVAIYSDYPFLRERLEALGLHTGLWIPLYGPESFGAQKPAVRPFLRIAEDLGVAPEEILVIGDREETDGLGAFGAGMRFFRLVTGRRYYYKLDPNRRRMKEEPHGPTLVMYAGAWDELLRQLTNKLEMRSEE